MKQFGVAFAFLLSCAVALAARAQDKPPPTDRDPQSKTEKVQAALKLCGSSYLAVSAKNREAALVAMEILKKEGELAEKLPLAAKSVADKVPEAEFFSVRIAPPKDLSLKQLQSLLGKEDNTAKEEFIIPSAAGPPDRIPVTFYFYDGYGFGATAAGKIIGIRADLQAFRAKPIKPNEPKK